MSHARRPIASMLVRTLVCGVAITLVLLAGARAAQAALPPGFQDTVALAGRAAPTAVRFAPDGRVFVLEKAGRVWVYQSINDTSPTLFADFSAKVHDFWDRGALGLAIPPDFPTGNDGVYVLYTYDGAIGGSAPTWNDNCPTPPGPTTDGCLVGARLSRLTGAGAGNVSTGEDVLIESWCQQFPSHSIGTVLFGNDGYLYVGAGEGANYNSEDYGQWGANYAGDKANPCGDPPGSAGTALQPPEAQGGALRSQSVRRTSGPTSLDGAIIRVDPRTGAAVSSNPYGGSADPNKARVIAYGLRNPFRFTARPGTNELWVGDVGWGRVEEVNRIAATGDGAVENFGWPCYEGATPSSYQGFGLDSCSTLYTLGGVTAPYYAYSHTGPVVSGDGCSYSGGSSESGIAFYPGGSYPSAYNGALFFADHTRNCIWAMLAGADGNPNPGSIIAFSPARYPVAIEVGPASLNRDLFYVDLDEGQIRRLSYSAGNQAPVARAAASPTQGNPPLTVQFNSGGSTDPDGDPLSYSWAFGDGGTSTAADPSHTYTSSGTYTARLTVTDPAGARGTADVTITVGITGSMTVNITDRATGAALSAYKVADNLNFRGSATGPGGALPPSAFTWRLELNHCPSGESCHQHDGGSISGVQSGTFSAPDHEYPSSLTLTMTARDPATGLATTSSTRLNPATVQLTFKSNPGGLRVGITSDAFEGPTPFTKTFVVGHALTINAPLQQTFNKQTYLWQSWSDGGAASHSFSAPAASRTYTATYRKR